MPLTAVVLRVCLQVLWSIVRWCLLALLIVFEPLVRTALAAIALLTAGSALFFRCFTSISDFPFAGMLALSVGCVLLLMLYYRLVELLSWHRLR